MIHFQYGNETQEHGLIFLKLIFMKRFSSKQNRVPTAKVFQVSLKMGKTSQFGQKKKKQLFSSTCVFFLPFHINVYTQEAFGLRVHVYKFTFFFFFSHLLTLGDNFYCYEQCIHCSHTVHTLFTY